MPCTVRTRARFSDLHVKLIRDIYTRMYGGSPYVQVGTKRRACVVNFDLERRPRLNQPQAHLVTLTHNPLGGSRSARGRQGNPAIHTYVHRERILRAHLKNLARTCEYILWCVVRRSL